MFWEEDQILNESFHFDRLFRGLHILGFDLPEHFSRSFVSGEIRKLCEKNAEQKNMRVRLNVFREDGSLLLPAGNKPLFIIETSSLQEQNITPIRLKIYYNEQKFPGSLSNLKTNNYLLNILSLQYAKANGFDDALILNSRGNCCETSSSNIFMIQKKIIYTPALSEGCVAGTKRRELLETLPTLGFEIRESSISPAMLFEMDEVFLSNAIRNICPIDKIDQNLFQCKTVLNIISSLNKS